MDFGSLRTLASELCFDAHGVVAVVTRPGEDAVTTTGIWQPPFEQDQPVGREKSARDPVRVMALRRSEFAEMEKGTLVTAAETIGGTSVDWQVDGIHALETDYYLARLVHATGV